MSKVLVGLITVYQMAISPFLKQILGIKSMCRYSPSCSQYAKQAIMKYGVAKGSYLSMLRFLSCQPWARIMNNELRIKGGNAHNL